jgi:hypothetical protein
MNDNRITIEVKPDGSTTITIYGSSVNVVRAEPDDEQSIQEEPTEAQRRFLMSRNRWEGNLNKEQAHRLIGEIKDQEATTNPSGALDNAANVLLQNNIRPDFLKQDTFPFEAPMKRKRGRPRK